MIWIRICNLQKLASRLLTASRRNLIENLFCALQVFRSFYYRTDLQSRKNNIFVQATYSFLLSLRFQR
jgi:hypothetical protein